MHKILIDGRRRLGRAGILVLAASLAACAATPVRPPPLLPRVASGPACLQDLNRHGISYQVPRQPAVSESCQIDTPIRAYGLSIRWNQPATMACQLGDVLMRFESEVVEPNAIGILGKPVTAERNLGAFSCRAAAGSGHRPSQHALGRAIDLAGWTLADGTRIDVEKDWTDDGPRGRFLHAVALGACRYFSVVLTPATNSEHHDHLHLDIGPDRLCSVG
ncbi:MAG TPA: extensin family protein [Aliidongia sp.]|uniref:extensin family protein n=1 Tax=Aliidongia sp. TaxID=1914230 RepID=UPI002DDCC79A|nr:extensin family protein [Aliidongia sp.]HEV2674004.1 extensin family protein [Aliidongia sp.]